MIETWFTSDTHFGHAAILEYEKEARPFSSLDEMHEAMIERWNSVVKPKDLVYHLGDVAFGRRHLALLARCNGRKKLVMGNHDSYQTACYLEHFEKLYGIIFWHQCVLTHSPVHPEGLGSRWMLNVHGHLHSNIITTSSHAIKQDGIVLISRGIPDPNYLNVSVEQNNLTPIHSDIIMERVKQL